MAHATGISLRIELAAAAGNKPAVEISDSKLVAGRSTRTTIAVAMTVEDEPPTGEIQLGTLRWRFSNRVEMLEAVDAAREEATASALRRDPRDHPSTARASHPMAGGR